MGCDAGKKYILIKDSGFFAQLTKRVSHISLVDGYGWQSSRIVEQ
jgi:hypothetical protein